MTESTTMLYNLSCCNDTVSGAAVIEMMESGLEPGKNVDAMIESRFVP